MAAYRCSICGTNWPHTPEYRECASCELKCDEMSNAVPLEADVAHSFRSHALFERYLETRGESVT
jgi:hypothetical protein